ncbi:MAG: SCP2 sterol-binding domain-containing protein, partial [Caldilineaceae bacterium]|nr:SCP2 sterol-binding domain-containing protein [Caldilineaceae bacterium]
ELARAELADQRADILAVFPCAQTLISIVCRMNRDAIRSPARSVANLEFHTTGDQVDETAHRIVAALERAGVRALNPAMGFPMEMNRFSAGKTWIVSHKPVAVAAGLGQMGIHRNVIHPQFGNFILLGTVMMDRPVTAYDHPIDYNPCLTCKLCVAACPVGAIGSDGEFNFTACYTHNYREFMGGFTDWVDLLADSADSQSYRQKVSRDETASLWQSLSYGANYKAAYCMAVCPAGEDVIEPFLANRKGYLQEVVKPLQEKVETVYVIAGSDAEAHVARRFPHKQPKRVHNGLVPTSVASFLRGLPNAFQPEQAAGLNITYHFTFTGAEERQATVKIQAKQLQVQEGHHSVADLCLIADSHTWVKFLQKEQNLVWAILRRRLRMKGNPRLLLAFGKCFPS